MGCPCSRPTPCSLWCLDLTQMVLAVRKKWKSTHLNISNNFCFNNFAQKPISGVLLAHGLLLAVFGVWTSPRWSWLSLKRLKSTHKNIPRNFCFYNFSQKSIPGVVLAEVLQEPVGASHGGQGWKFWVPPMFLGPGGQAGSNDTPHLAVASTVTIPQGGGRCWIIYKDSIFVILFGVLVNNPVTYA